jgi:hypothetical protein
VIVRIIVIAVTLLVPFTAKTQEVWFFYEGTDNAFYDQGIVNVGSMSPSFFEHTHPPGGPQWNDKIPCSTTAFKGATSLKFNYTSNENGNWRATVFRKGWTTAELAGLDSLSFYMYSESTFPVAALPLIGLIAVNKSGTGDVSSKLYPLSAYNSDIPAGQWIRVGIPLSVITGDNENSQLNFAAVKGVIFNQSEKNGTSRLILIDEITAFKSLAEIPSIKDLVAEGYDSHAELNWEVPLSGLTYKIEASFDGGTTYEPRGQTTNDYYLDFVPSKGRNKEVNYRITTLVQGRESMPVETSANLRDFTDDELMDMFQRYTFRYFWEGAHQASGMALERSNGNGRTVASGATGMGLMAMIVAYEREYRPRHEIKDRILKILHFLENCDRHHGAWSHWYNGDTFRTQPFSPDDDGGDIVETSFVAQALLALKNYFSETDAKSEQIRQKSNQLWREIRWDWYRNGNQNVLYWHWSPNFGFAKNMKVTGWNECLVTYVMAASSPTYSIPKEVYDEGWARNGQMVRKRTYYVYDIYLSPDWGGPLFWIHYSHLGINPKGLKDQYADYWQEYVNTAKIHHAYAIDNPFYFPSYGAKNWGLTASDSPFGYKAHEPMRNDNGTISPTAALASMPYTPEESMKALKYFYRERGSELFGKYGPYDAFNDAQNWVQKAWIGIDQGPILVMIENHRSGLLWETVMKNEELQAGLNKLGFQFEVPTSTTNIIPGDLRIFPNPANEMVFIQLPDNFSHKQAILSIFSMDGRLLVSKQLHPQNNQLSGRIDNLEDGYYIIQLNTGKDVFHTKLLVRKK